MAATLIASGSEVHLAISAQKRLASDGIPVRVVSMPCWETFAKQDAAYQASVLPPDMLKISIEAGVSFGWERFTGTDGAQISIDRYGASAPGEVNFRELGFTEQHVCDIVRATVEAKTATP